MSKFRFGPVLVIAFLLSAIASSATESKLILGDQVFSLREEPKSVCGESPATPEYAAALVALKLAYDLSAKLAGPSVGLRSMFKQIRRYPSRFESAGCAQLRRECETICRSSGVSDQESCLIECHQYEAWNR